MAICMNLLTQLKFQNAATDSSLHIDLDDISAKSQFAYAYIDSSRSSAQIKINLTNVITGNLIFLLFIP